MLKLSAAALFLLATAAGLTVTVWPDEPSRIDPPAIAFQGPIAQQQVGPPQQQQAGGPRVVLENGVVIPLGPAAPGVFVGSANNQFGVPFSAVLAIIPPGANPSHPNGLFIVRVGGGIGTNAWGGGLDGQGNPQVVRGTMTSNISGTSAHQRMRFTVFAN
jgi:hypothetical protein